MRLFPADYLADTQHLTTEEHGAYLLLMMNYWQRGKPLDNSNNRLAHVCGMSIEQWIEVQKVLQEFFIIVDETWFHSRIDSDLNSIDELLESRSRAGIRSGEARRNKCSTSVQQVLNKTRTQREQNTNNKIIKDKIIKDTSISSTFNQFWEVYPRHQGRKPAEASFVRALKAASLETILNGARRYAAASREPQFTLLPATWLNQERWNDEGTTSKPTPTPPQMSQNDRKVGIPMPEGFRDLLPDTLKFARKRGKDERKPDQCRIP